MRYPQPSSAAPGYAEFLEAQADPNHEAHAEMMDLHGGTFDPDDAGIDRILDNFERLAKKWAPKVTSRPL
ncbi:IS1096 element passenger TnpR family protein [Cereibacter azotoformans]|uniref:IS1096 element passenger TnpR family protein n=1 Tax=Cereibacter azotoformans TaxID=43057 RepID=UPI003144EF17